ncbi:MAG: HK97 gp10 family phage protein [Lachnospiraceae bacterium]|jgi:HK97 gp10 family phage protein|nr:HK97 gp10 family phage protein [Lachnospiraceae bacterium]
MSSIEGLDSLLSKLSKLGGDVNESCKKGLMRGAKKIQRNAKLLAPVKTGQLRNSIKVQDKSEANNVKVQVYTDVEHSAYVEFGTGQRGISSNIERPDDVSYKADWKGQPAQPFMTPSFLQAQNSGEVENEVAKEIEQDIRRLGG